MGEATTTTTKRRTRIPVALALTAVALGIVALVATSRPGADPGLPVVQDGGLAWASTVVRRSSDGDQGGARVTARVDLDGTAFPTATGPDDQFVLYQLAGGRFDTEQHTDDRTAERVLGFTDDDSIDIRATGDGLRADQGSQPRSGEYTLSLDGSVEYGDVPRGTWELRAYVLDRDGSWGGPVAIRSFTVR